MKANTGREHEDVQRVLAMTWRGDKRPILGSDLARMWSFDFQWFSPEVADEVIGELVKQGWLEPVSNGMIPCVDTSTITAPLGWWPRQESLTNPPSFSQDAMKNQSLQSDQVGMGTSNESPRAAQELAPNQPITVDNSDPRSKLVPRLIKYVARKAQLPNEEVKRRMLRKQRSLGPITPWMCLILIAKEQALEVDDIVAMFE